MKDIGVKTYQHDAVRTIFAADIDGDGDTDLLSANSLLNIAWYENVNGGVLRSRK